MTAEDLARIEAELGVRLPADYRALMLAYPFPPDSFTAEFCIPNNATHLIEINRDRVTASLPRYNEERDDPPASYFEIGGDGGEERYLVDLAQPESPVYVYDLESAELRQAAPGLQAFIAQCVATDDMIRKDEEATAGKRWWQLWG